MMHDPQVEKQTATSLSSIGPLREIAQSLSATLNLETTLDLIVHRTTAVMSADSCSLYLLDPSGDTLRLHATTGLAKQAIGRATLRVGEGMTGRAVASNGPIFSATARLDPRYRRIDEAEEDIFESLLAIPLYIGADIVGGLNIQSIATRHFEPDEIELLELIGDLAAGAVVKARLHDQQKRQIEELSALATASEALTSPQYLDEILNIVTEMAAETMEAAVCSVFLVNEAGTHLEMRSAMRQGTPYQPRKPLPVGAGVIGRVYETGRLAYVADVQLDKRYLGGKLARQEGLVSLLAVPLTVRGRKIGVMVAYTDAQRQFTNEQRSWFSTLSNQTALAIENARLVTNSAVVKEMHHRIKNNLQTVAMLMQLQLADANNLSAHQVLNDNIHRVHSIATVHEVLSEKGFQLVDVRDVLERIIHMTTTSMTAPTKVIDIRLAGGELLLPSRVATSLTLAINELIQNSIEHGFAALTAGQIDVEIKRTVDGVELSVRDDGQGLAEDFERGLGLELVETLVGEDLGGRLTYRRLPRGSEITVHMPRIESAPEQAE